MARGIMQVGKGLHFQGQDSFSCMLYMCFNVNIKWLLKKEQLEEVLPWDSDNSLNTERYFILKRHSVCW